MPFYPSPPSILLSIISLCRELPLRIGLCPILLPCLVLIISIKDIFSSTFFNTSLFALCSVQPILFILLHIHISKASIRLTSSFLIVHVCAPYSVTLHVSALTILFLMSIIRLSYIKRFFSHRYPFLDFFVAFCIT